MRKNIVLTREMAFMLWEKLGKRISTLRADLGRERCGPRAAHCHWTVTQGAPSYGGGQYRFEGGVMVAVSLQATSF